MSCFPFDKFDPKALWDKPHPFMRWGPPPEGTPEPQTISDLLIPLPDDIAWDETLHRPLDNA